MEPKLEVGVPKNFGMPEVIVANLYSMLPFGAIGAVAIGLSIAAGVFFGTLADSGTGVIVFALALLVTGIAGLALLICLFPICQANPYIRMLVNRNLGPKQPDSIAYVCQCSLSPRLHGGLRGFLEDADDVGRVEITGEGILFSGDHVTLSLPFTMIDDLIRVNCGYRMLGICGDRVRLFSRAIEGIEFIEFLERESNTVPASRRLSEEMIYAIGYGMHLEGEETEAASG